MSRIVFLDFDGVLNSMRFFGCDSKRGYRRARRVKHELPHEAIDPEAVARLNRIVEATGAKVVISSTWRVHFDHETIAVFLERRGFQGEVIGATPVDCTLPSGVDYYERGHEIAMWMAPDPNGDAPAVESFVILDDCSDMAHLKPWLVQTDTETGLLDEHVERAVNILDRVLP